jgi:hypothetical protein
MQEHGDLILRVFHKHNFTYNGNLDWHQLLRQIEEANDSQSRELLEVLNKQLLTKLLLVYRDI